MKPGRANFLFREFSGICVRFVLFLTQRPLNRLRLKQCQIVEALCVRALTAAEKNVYLRVESCATIPVQKRCKNDESYCLAAVVYGRNGRYPGLFAGPDRDECRPGKVQACKA